MAARAAWLMDTVDEAGGVDDAAGDVCPVDEVLELAFAEDCACWGAVPLATTLEVTECLSIACIAIVVTPEKCRDSASSLSTSFPAP